MERIFCALVGLAVLTGCGSNHEETDTSGEASDKRQASNVVCRAHLIENGESRSLDLVVERQREIVDLLVHDIEKHEMVVRVAPSPVPIEELRGSIRCLEVVLPEPRRVQAGNSGLVLQSFRFLVPLSGDYAGRPGEDGYTIFHGAAEYSRGPLIIRSGRRALLAFLAGAGVTGTE